MAFSVLCIDRKVQGTVFLFFAMIDKRRRQIPPDNPCFLYRGKSFFQQSPELFSCREEKAVDIHKGEEFTAIF